MIITPIVATLTAPSSLESLERLKAEPNASLAALKAPPMPSTALAVLWICANVFQAALLSLRRLASR